MHPGSGAAHLPRKKPSTRVVEVFETHARVLKVPTIPFGVVEVLKIPSGVVEVPKTTDTGGRKVVS